MHKIFVKGDYKQSRVEAYPELGDQLDAIMKGLEAYSKGESLPQDTLDWIDTCRTIKQTYPKGTTNV